MTPEIIPEIAKEQTMCVRCFELGIMTEIPKGAKFIILRLNGRIFDCCTDCFQRLAEQIKAGDVSEEF